jgi:putative pyruvate formate lyase activating enzyme
MNAKPPPALRLGRPERARANAAQARAMLSACRFCAHECGADRQTGPAGLCHAGPQARFFAAQTEVTDELELIPTYAIAFSGCDLRCAFCISGAESWNALAGEPFDAARPHGRGGGTRSRGRALSWCWAANPPCICMPRWNWFRSCRRRPPGVENQRPRQRQARSLLDGMFDVWLADFKFGNDPARGPWPKSYSYTPSCAGTCAGLRAIAN